MKPEVEMTVSDISEVSQLRRENERLRAALTDLLKMCNEGDFDGCKFEYWLSRGERGRLEQIRSEASERIKELQRI